MNFVVDPRSEFKGDLKSTVPTHAYEKPPDVVYGCASELLSALEKKCCKPARHSIDDGKFNVRIESASVDLFK